MSSNVAEDGGGGGMHRGREHPSLRIVRLPVRSRTTVSKARALEVRRVTGDTPSR